MAFTDQFLIWVHLAFMLRFSIPHLNFVDGWMMENCTYKSGDIEETYKSVYHSQTTMS